MEQEVVQLQQEVLMLKAQVAAESGHADAVRAINNLANYSVSEGHSEPHRREGLGSSERILRQRGGFSAVVQEDGGLLRGSDQGVRDDARVAAEQGTEIARDAIDLEFLLASTNVERGVCRTWIFVLQQMHTALMALTSSEANDIVANSRRNPWEAWRRLQKRYDLTTGRRKRSLLRTIIFPGRCSLSLFELQAGIERWESYVSRYEKKLKNKIDDEIKLACLEALVPEELGKHSNRLRPSRRRLWKS